MKATLKTPLRNDVSYFRYWLYAQKDWNYYFYGLQWGTYGPRSVPAELPQEKDHQEQLIHNSMCAGSSPKKD